MNENKPYYTKGDLDGLSGIENRDSLDKNGYVSGLFDGRAEKEKREKEKKSGLSDRNNLSKRL